MIFAHRIDARWQPRRASSVTIRFPPFRTTLDSMRLLTTQVRGAGLVRRWIGTFIAPMGMIPTRVRNISRPYRCSITLLLRCRGLSYGFPLNARTIFCAEASYSLALFSLQRGSPGGHQLARRGIRFISAPPRLPAPIGPPNCDAETRKSPLDASACDGPDKRRRLSSIVR